MNLPLIPLPAPFCQGTTCMHAGAGCADINRNQVLALHCYFQASPRRETPQAPPLPPLGGFPSKHHTCTRVMATVESCGNGMHMTCTYNKTLSSVTIIDSVQK